MHEWTSARTWIYGDDSKIQAILFFTDSLYKEYTVTSDRTTWLLCQPGSNYKIWPSTKCQVPQTSSNFIDSNGLQPLSKWIYSRGTIKMPLSGSICGSRDLHSIPLKGYGTYTCLK